MEPYKKSYIKDDSINARCVACVNLFTDSTSAKLINSAGLNFDNIASLLSTCDAWNLFSDKYYSYKITGVMINVVPVHNDSDIINGTCSVPVYFAMFPSDFNVIKYNGEIIEKDDSFKAMPKITSVQEHFWEFPDNYLESVGGGLGTWTTVENIQYQTGQISFANYPLGGNFSVEKLLYQVHYDFYVSFRNRRV